jgi:hypothetical protein
MKQQFTSFIAGFFACLIPSMVYAGPPFLTDDPEPVDKGHGEFYIASLDTWSGDGVMGTLPHFEFNYGPIENVQLHVIAPITFNRPADTGDMTYGYGDTELGVKWRFIQEDSLFKGCPQVGIFPLLEVPTGDANRGLGSGHLQEFIPVWMQKSWGTDNRQWTVYGGGGYEFNPGTGNENFGFFGAVLQKQLTDNFTLGGELFHFTPSAHGQAAHTGFNIGCIYDFSDHWHLLFSLGRDIVGDNRLTGYTAIQLTF